jgi:hypothetical protein
MTAGGTYRGPRAGETRRHTVTARSVEYGHEDCTQCSGRTTVVYVNGWETDDGVVDRLRAVVGERHSAKCPLRPEAGDRSDAPQPVLFRWDGDIRYDLVDGVVTFRPDGEHVAQRVDTAPQPATTDDAVERAARALVGFEPSEYADSPEMRGQWRARAARAALAAAGAGEAVDREALGRIVADLAFKEWGILADGAPRISHLRIVDAVLAARGYAAPTVSAAKVREAVEASGQSEAVIRSLLDVFGIEVIDRGGI